MNKPRYLKKANESFLFPYSDMLARRDDLYECDEHGNRIYTQMEKPDEKPAIIIPPPEQTTDSNGLTDSSSKVHQTVNYESLSRDELFALASGLGLRIHPSAKTETIIRKLRESDGV
jgi:hypothetical protein